MKIVVSTLHFVQKLAVVYFLKYAQEIERNEILKIPGRERVYFIIQDVVGRMRVPLKFVGMLP